MHSEQQMRIRNITVVLITGYALAGCASGPKVISDYDHDAPFGTYKTYNFIENAGPHNSTYQDFFSQYMVAAITIEMELRGYIKSDDPDLLVNFNAMLQEKTEVTTTPAPPPMGGYYRYRGSYYGAWGRYGYGTETRVSQYTEGTFNIDIVDAKRKQLIWEAVGKGRISQKALGNLEATINEGVPKYFALYPFQAGSANPVTPE